jgi:uncharacterized protein (TIGR02271 family)
LRFPCTLLIVCGEAQAGGGGKVTGELRMGDGPGREHTPRHGDEPEQYMVPVVEEQTVIQIRERQGQSVRIRKVDRGGEELLRIPVTTQRVDVQRIPINAPAEGPVAPWHDGETLVIPVMEQVPVVRLQWVVREEIRVRRLMHREERQQSIRLRREEVSIERTGPPAGDSNPESR